MARLFTVPFSYQQQMYTAVVSLTACGDSSTVSIHLPDETLHPILQGSTISFDARKGLPVDHPNFTEAQKLLLGILVAIEEHDQTFRSSTRENQPH